MEAIALYTGQPFIMAMTPVQTVMVTITLIVAPSTSMTAKPTPSKA
jgi:Ca2+/H+ antiporter